MRRFDQNLLESSGRLAARVTEAVPRCWFCPTESGKQTKEHLFPQWLLRHMQAEREQVEPFRFSIPLGRIASQRPKMPLSAATCGEVCAACNNGWMSGLERRVRPILTGSTDTGRIDAESASLLARWFTKTSVAINVSMPYRLLFTAEQRHALKHGMPAGVTVALFRVTEQDGAVDWVQGLPAPFIVPTGSVATSVVQRVAEMTYVAHIRIADLVGVVATIPVLPHLGPGQLLTDAAPLWPSDSHDLKWEDLPTRAHYTEIMSTWDFAG